MSAEDGAAFLVPPPKKDKEVVALDCGEGANPLTVDTMDTAVATTREIFMVSDVGCDKQDNSTESS